MQKFVTPKPAETQQYQLSQIGGGGAEGCASLQDIVKTALYPIM